MILHRQPEIGQNFAWNENDCEATFGKPISETFPLGDRVYQDSDSDDTPYRQENVLWVMYFFEDYAVHGAYWRNSFGHVPTQNCINVPVDVAAQLRQWALPATTFALRRMPRAG